MSMDAKQIIYGLDAGPTESAWVKLRDGKIAFGDTLPNEEMLGRMQSAMLIDSGVLAAEMVQHYGSGMAVGKEVFDTVFWIGRFVQAFNGPFELITRPTIKSHVCGSAKAKDPNVRQALIDRLGPVGTKRNPGPCYGISKHLWSALAVAVTASDRLADPSRPQVEAK